MSNSIWEYQIVKAESSDAFLVSMNTAGREGWEAISGAYGVGESTRVSLGQGMPVSTKTGASMWIALLKRRLKD